MAQQNCRMGWNKMNATNEGDKQTGGLTYEKAGVVGLGKDKGAKHFFAVRETLSLAKGRIIETPFGNLYQTSGTTFQSKGCDGVGTKVLLAELAGKHDTIGIDAIATVANDCIRSGATPIALTNTIDAPNPAPELIDEIINGIAEGARQANCPVVGGETAGLPDLFSAGYVLNCDCVGEVEEQKIILADELQPGDAIIGLRSSGPHANGISLLRKALFKKWGGKYEAWEKVDGLEKELVLEALTPTKIYVKEFLAFAGKTKPKAALHVTGDAYNKFGVLGQGARGLGFEFDNFSPQPIFRVIQEAGRISDQEMFKRFNMGWGFAVVVEARQAEDALQALGSQAEKIGVVTNNGRIAVKHAGKTIVLS